MTHKFVPGDRVVIEYEVIRVSDLDIVYCSAILNSGQRQDGVTLAHSSNVLLNKVKEIIPRDFKEGDIVSPKTCPRDYTVIDFPPKLPDHMIIKGNDSHVHHLVLKQYFTIVTTVEQLNDH
jgi:hypothetical protein